MKFQMQNRSRSQNMLLFALGVGLALPLPAPAASVSLATAPLATSTTTSVKPNLLMLLDNSGSMDWDHMPDDSSDGGSSVTFQYGYYGIRSSQCNQVFFDPTINYRPPVNASSTNYPDSVFTGAWDNGFNTGNGTVNLDTGFQANQSGVQGNAGDTDTAGPAYYYNYSGTQTTQLQKNYNSTANTFYAECNSAQNTMTGLDVFTRIQLSTTATATVAGILVSGTSSTSVSGIMVNGTEQIMAGPTAASTSSSTLAGYIAAQINLCTTGAGGNCTTPGGHGYTATVSGSTVVITTTTTSNLDAANATLSVTRGNTGTMTFATGIAPKADATRLTNFANWYSYYRTRMLMMKTAAGRAFSNLGNHYRIGLAKYSSSTPVLTVGSFESTQRSNWYSTLYGISTSGSTPTRTALSNAGRYFAGKLAVTDPIQYSCQQNFTILSTDGYWNSGDGKKLDGTTIMDNQDGSAGRPMYDGAQSATTWTWTYTRYSYTKVTDNCTGKNSKKLKTQPQIGTCTTTSLAATCTPTNWISNGTATLAASCTTTSAPSPSTPVQQGSPVETPGSIVGTSNTLADVAMYYYVTDLRTSALGNCTGAIAGEDVCNNNVFTTPTDNNAQQHMTTFTLGLGASGWMNYSSSYLTDTTGDYVAVKQGSTADSTATPPVCSWQANGTACNWPFPGMNGSSDGFIANVDDLWHAAVNGRGAYFAATNPTTLSTSLSNALSAIDTRRGAAAAAATSTLNPVAGNNYAYVASYTTVRWKGNLEARGINVDTGTVNVNATWCAESVTADTCASPSAVVPETTGSTTTYYCVTPNSVICTYGTLVGTDCKVQMATNCTGTMGTMVSDTADTRTIKTANSSGTALVDFTYNNLTAAQQAYFNTTTISALSQWSSFSTAQQTVAAGANLVNYLRGQYGYDDRTTNAVENRLFRYREAVLGDALESQPAYMSRPVFSYPYPGYSDFKTTHATRAGTVYIGANDGMMHAFAGDTGMERWAYVPSMVIPSLWKLADRNYATMHTNYVNGSANTADICVSGCDAVGAVWKTILVAGLNGGGRGYYALDITDPSAPALLWEFTPTGGMGAVTDPDIGYSFGMPVVTRKNDGTWVVLVTSGYNNTNPGDGKGYLYVLNAATGGIISKISTGVGDTTTPSGLAKIAAWNEESTGNRAGSVYGGDLLGNLWRFDINGSTAAAIGTGDVLKFATLFSDTAGTSPQAITTTPVLALIDTKRYVLISTGKYLETGDLTTTQTHSLYSIRDDNVSSTIVNPRNTLTRQTLSANANGTATRTSSNNAVQSGGPGCYVDYPDTGERANIDSKLVQEILIAPTIVPSNTACSPGGYGWLNYFNYRTCGATAVRSDSTIVGINVIYVQGRPIVEIVTSTNPTPYTPSVQPEFGGLPGGFSSHRAVWREMIP